VASAARLGPSSKTEGVPLATRRRLNITVTPRMGRAILWPSVRDDDLYKDDHRTEHEALPVTRGIKCGAASAAATLPLPPTSPSGPRTAPRLPAQVRRKLLDAPARLPDAAQVQLQGAAARRDRAARGAPGAGARGSNWRAREGDARGGRAARRRAR
jgi:hypothetical protein